MSPATKTGVGLIADVGVFVTLGVMEDTAITVGDGDVEGCEVGATVIVLVGLGDAASVGLGFGATVAVGVGLGATVAVGVGIGTAVGVGVGAGGGLQVNVIPEFVSSVLR